MLNLSDLLEKYKNLAPTDGLIKDELIRILEEWFSLSLTRDDIRLSRDVIYVSVSSVVKSVIMIHKKRILDALFDATKQRFTDIR